MNYDKFTNVERIIAKIDNDFNPDNSDWIPRVPSWIHDALSQLDVLQIKDKTITLDVKDGYARMSCCFGDNFKVYDLCGNPIKEAGDDSSCGCERDDSFTGGVSEIFVGSTASIEKYEEHEYPNRTSLLPVHKVRDIVIGSSSNTTYVKVDPRTIHLSDNTLKKIKIKVKTIDTRVSEHYNVELPVVPNNGTLIEAVTYYCMYKMLCRGMKHPVFNLAASQYGTNPYFMWTRMKDEAKRSVINDGIDEILDDGAWRNFFYNATFPKK